MSRLRRVTRLCSSMLSVNCEQVAKDTVEKILCRTQFRSGHMSAICARLSKGKVGVQRGRETAGVPSFLPSAVGTAPSPRRAPHSPALRRAQLPAEVQRKTLRPSGANPPAAVRVPRWVGAEKEPPRQGEPANAVRAPRWVGAENPGNPEKIFPPEKAAKTPVLTLRKRLSERYS